MLKKISIILVICFIALTGCSQPTAPESATPNVTQEKVDKLDLLSISNLIDNFYSKDGYSIIKIQSEEDSYEMTTIKSEDIEFIIPVETNLIQVFKGNTLYSYDIDASQVIPLKEDSTSPIQETLKSYAGLLKDAAEKNIETSKYSLDNEGKKLSRYVIDFPDAKEVLSKYFDTSSWDIVDLHFEIILDESEIVEYYLKINEEIQIAIMFGTDLTQAYSYVGYNPLSVKDYI